MGTVLICLGLIKVYLEAIHSIRIYTRGVLVHLVRVHDTGIYGSYVLYVFRHMGEIRANTEMILEYL